MSRARGQTSSVLRRLAACSARRRLSPCHACASGAGGGRHQTASRDTGHGQRGGVADLADQRRGLEPTVVRNTVYVTGSFTKARPPGVAVGGAGEVMRSTSSPTTSPPVTGSALQPCPQCTGPSDHRLAGRLSDLRRRRFHRRGRGRARTCCRLQHRHRRAGELRPQRERAGPGAGRHADRQSSSVGTTKSAAAQPARV